MADCSGFELQDSEKFGRFVIAKRVYQYGDLILDEEPLLISPFGKQDISSSDPNSKDFIESTLECVGCFKSLLPEELKFCPKCRWPICCNACSEELLHVKYECPIFEEKKIGVSAEVYSRIYILRAVLMYKDQENPARWGKISSLCSTSSLSPGGRLPKSAEEIQDLTQFLTQCFQIEVDPWVVGQITGAWTINAFGMEEPDENGSIYRAEGLYSLGSMFAHSCSPNAEWVILPKDNDGIKKWNLRVYARRKIRTGEAINISYLSDCFIFDTRTRQHFLSQNFYFDCKCDRCCDPSDLSFYMEAIKCPLCSDETLTADDPKDEYSLWTCNHCKVSKPSSYAKSCVELCLASKGLVLASCSQTTLEIILSSNAKVGLNPNHRENMLNMFYWIHSSSSDQFEKLCQISSQSDGVFVKFIKIVTKCLKAFRMFGGMADIVRLESCLARAIAAYYFKTTDFCSIQYDPYLSEEKLKIVKAICAHLQVAVDTMAWYPYNFFYFQLKLDLVDGYKFWNEELDVLKDWCSVEMSFSSIDLNGQGVDVKNKVAQLQSSPNELKEPCAQNSDQESSFGLLKEAVEREKVSVSQSPDLLPSDVIDSPRLSNLIPPVSLLSKLDL